MRRLIGVLSLVMALAGAFLLGRCTAPTTVDAERAAASESMAADAGPEETGTAVHVAPGNDRLATDRAGTSAVPASSVTVRPLDTPATSGVPEPAIPPSSGPQPLQQDDAAKLAKAESHLAAEGGVWRDLLELAAQEEQDDAARRLEQRIAQAILRHGARYTLLRLAPPRCTHSACIVRSVGIGRGNHPRSDWQSLSRAIMNEPWFRESFDDMRSSMSVDGGEIVYVTIFVRCDPGECRLGSR